jgi:membrane protease YdiL (CAAX protease family)
MSRLRSEHELATSRRLRAFAWFFIAIIFALFAQQFADRASIILFSGPLAALGARLVYVLLLVAGFAAMGIVGQRQANPVAQMGLPIRPGYGPEWALGAALGWAAMVACLVPVVLVGDLLVTASGLNEETLGRTLLALATLLIAALADELVFRGYPFQRLLDATSPALATIAMTLLFTIGHGVGPDTTAGGTLSTLLLGLVLAMAYLRTRALWVGWGLHFAWNASMSVLFGLPIAGLTGFSPVISTYTTGPAWLTGGGYGPEGSAIAVLVLVALLFVLARATRDLRHRWALPEIVAGGIAVDIDAAANRQHEAAMGPGTPVAAAGKSLVQIAPAAAPATLPPVRPARSDPPSTEPTASE